MFEPHLRFQPVEQRFDYEALAQQQFVEQGHQIVLHVAADAGNQMQPPPPQFGEEFLGDIALVGQHLAFQFTGHIVENGAVVRVAGSDLDSHDFTLVVDDHVQLEAVEPARRGFAAFGQVGEDTVAGNAQIVANGNLGAVGDIDAGLVAGKAMHEYAKRDEKPGHERHETPV